jgi:spermidine/putrescine-binding protein
MKQHSIVSRIICLLLSIFCSSAIAQENERKAVRVRMLSWWGYIDPQNKAVNDIAKKCRATLSIDEFYSTTEFLERVSKQSQTGQNYDVLIYSDTAYNTKETTFLRNSKRRLKIKPALYSRPIAQFYKKQKYKPATGVFQLSLSGFLVNRDLSKMQGNESLGSIFRLAGDNLAVLMDDHMEIATLLNKWECTELNSSCKKNAQLAFPSEDKLKKLVGQSKVVISSDLADITKHPKFALAYTWSGDAIQKLSAQSNLSFILHPSLSHSSMDLLTLVGESKEANCVASEFASKEFIESVSQKSKYFSPYGPVRSQDEAFSKLQQEFFEHFSTLGRIHQVTQEESLEIDKKWQLFKILFGSKL